MKSLQEYLVESVINEAFNLKKESNIANKIQKLNKSTIKKITDELILTAKDEIRYNDEYFFTNYMEWSLERLVENLPDYISEIEDELEERFESDKEDWLYNILIDWVDDEYGELKSACKDDYEIIIEYYSVESLAKELESIIRYFVK